MIGGEDPPAVFDATERLDRCAASLAEASDDVWSLGKARTRTRPQSRRALLSLHRSTTIRDRSICPA